MGTATSTYLLEASDLHTICSNTSSECGNLKIKNGVIAFSSAPSSGALSTVANASGKRLRLFYHKEKLQLEDLLDSDTTKKVFKLKSDNTFIDLLPNLHLEVPSLEKGLTSVLVTNLQDGEVYADTITLNLVVPLGASFILTSNNEVKFRKSGGGVWIDEDDHDHGPQCDPEAGS